MESPKASFSGYVLKINQSAWGGTKRRYLALEDGVLSIYKSEAKGTPIKAIRLSVDAVVTQVTRNGMTCIEVRSPSDSFGMLCFTTDTFDMQTMWVQRINQNIEITRQKISIANEPLTPTGGYAPDEDDDVKEGEAAAAEEALAPASAPAVEGEGEAEVAKTESPEELLLITSVDEVVKPSGTTPMAEEVFPPLRVIGEKDYEGEEEMGVLESKHSIIAVMGQTDHEEASHGRCYCS